MTLHLHGTGDTAIYNRDPFDFFMILECKCLMVYDVSTAFEDSHLWLCPDHRKWDVPSKLEWIDAVEKFGQEQLDKFIQSQKENN